MESVESFVKIMESEVSLILDDKFEKISTVNNVTHIQGITSFLVFYVIFNYLYKYLSKLSLEKYFSCHI